MGNNKPENNVKLRLGTHEFQVQLGNVLKDKVATKYYLVDNNKKEIIVDDDNKFIELNKMKDKKVVVTQIGYSTKDSSKNSITIATMPTNTVEVPKHLPLKIKSLENAFLNLNSDQVLNLDEWDVSNVVVMKEMFFGAANFNQDISKWKTKNVTNMTGLFSGAENFNKPLNLWNVSKVTTMANMFDGASKFNQDLNDWDVSKVINMEEMFRSAESFNGKIGDWNVENVEILDDMFLYATKFQQDLSEWKTKKVKSKRWNFIFNHTYKYKYKVLEAWNKNI
ncbi:BspA family leucine-rich repeat surface protein [Mycoplasma bovis]|nr:BspA family leucine-rich repeat surface protein [Mycoplasmopsis bovis]MBT1345293.1 BspA family leucine-rich repeat surface protein [Mycoplasmopsis bovis]MBT1386699.1 BspA family leucine-rich repeat surface protein [Mycoplasmopsis bovis]MBT1419076.1 BspA family leucine-rich repeat surface protein [Mycoplasmopsis bovis]MBT1419418.1 BspA family leucine-rich repeat surface protein [Mycoplasmopsis bovis]UJB25648.1 BspA family leucine-rich repeat surface protein [Mycoplasmopsis bovis]